MATRSGKEITVVSRMRWIVIGALLAASSITGGSWWFQARQQRLAAERAAREEALRVAAELRAQNEALAREKARLEQERQALAQVIERLNVEHRVAHVDVLQQHTDADNRVVQTVLRLTEIDRDGEPLEPRIIGVPSKTPHFDALVIKFDKESVARGDALRGHSLSLFRRVYGDNQAPEAGYWLSTPGEPPSVYRVDTEPSEFELQLWREFWSYATDPQKAREAGVRVAQGEAVYAPMSAGERWTLTLDAAGGLNLNKSDPLPTSNAGLAKPPSIPKGAKLHAPPPTGEAD
jgi:hypothetical protein